MDSIEKKFADSMSQGPDILSIKVKFDLAKVNVSRKPRTNHRFVQKSPTNELGKVSYAVRDALTLDFELDDYLE